MLMVMSRRTLGIGRALMVTTAVIFSIACQNQPSPSGTVSSAVPPEPALTRPMTLRFYKDPAPAPTFEVQTLTQCPQLCGRILEVLCILDAI